MKKTYYSLFLVFIFGVCFSSVKAQVYWYESFGSYNSGTPLDGQGNWIIQNNPTAGFMVQSASPLTMGALLTDNNYMTGGFNWDAAGVNIPIPDGSAFKTNHLCDLYPTVIGYKAGSTNELWFSMLVRADGEDNFVGAFHGGGGPTPWWNNTWDLAIMRKAWSHQWGVVVGGNQLFSSTTSDVGTTALVVAKIEFQTDGTIISLFINPILGTPPSSPDITAKSTTSFGFNAMQFYPGFNANAYSMDEIRIGETYADVTPSETSLIDENYQNKLFVYTFDNKINVDLSYLNEDCIIELINIKGIIIKSVQSTGGKKVIFNSLSKGIYMVNVLYSNKVISNKVIL